jgi:hypothetical protein
MSFELAPLLPQLIVVVYMLDVLRDSSFGVELCRFSHFILQDVSATPPQ